MPFKLFAYEFFRQVYNFQSSLLSCYSPTAILTIAMGSPLISCFVATIIFMFVQILTAFLIVSEDMDSRQLQMRSLMRDWPNHWISVRSLGLGIDSLFLRSLNRYRQVSQQDQTIGHIRDQQKLKQCPCRFKATTKPYSILIIPLLTKNFKTLSKFYLLEMSQHPQNSFQSSFHKKRDWANNWSVVTFLLVIALQPKLDKAVAMIASTKKMWLRVLRQYVRVNNFTKLVCQKLTCTQNMSFWDLLRIPSSKDSVLFTEIEESAQLRVILQPREEIYLANQLDCYCRESSEIPLRFIKTTEATMAGPAITSFLPKSLTILSPNCDTLCVKSPQFLESQSFTEIKSQNSIQILPQFYLKTSTAFRTLDRLSLVLASPIISQVKVLPSSIFQQLMLTGKMKASLSLPYATFEAITERIPNLGASIFPVLLLVPSTKNSKQWLFIISLERYSFIMALQSYLYFFWLRLMKKAPDFLRRM